MKDVFDGKYKKGGIIGSKGVGYWIGMSKNE